MAAGGIGIEYGSGSSDSPKIIRLGADSSLSQSYPLLGIGRVAKVLPNSVPVLDLSRRFSVQPTDKPTS